MDSDRVDMTYTKPTNIAVTDRLRILHLTNNRRIETYQKRPMTAGKLYTSLTANSITSKLSNHFQQTRGLLTHQVTNTIK